MFGGFARILTIRANEIGFSPTKEQAEQIKARAFELAKPKMSLAEQYAIIDQAIRDVMQDPDSGQDLLK